MNIKFIICVIIVAIILSGLFFIFKPQQQQPAKNITIPPTTSQPMVMAFELVVKDRKLVSGPEVIKVMEGDQITIKITADENEELHLHGYNKSVDLEKGIPAELSFIANLTGRFPYELEKSKTDIGALEVSPK